MTSTKRNHRAALLKEVNHQYGQDDSHQPHPHSQDGVAAAKKSNALKIKLDHMGSIKAMSPNQQSFFDAYNAGYYCMMLYGSAGTGKTMISVYKGLEDVLSNDTPYEKLIIVRSAVQGRDVGFLPGDAEEKMEMYEMPYVSICEELFNRKDAYSRLKEQDKIVFVSSSFLRGMTFNNCIIVADEIQNYSFEELNTLITRTGRDSKLIMIGDYRQNDLVKSKYDVSGLGKFHTILKTMSEYTGIEFTTDDICRSSLVKNYLIALEKVEMEALE